MVEKKKHGRPRGSHPVKVTPEFRENPDIEKLGQALITAAISLAKKKADEEEGSNTRTPQIQETPTDNGEGWDY